MSGWLILIFSITAVSAITLLIYIQHARKCGDCVLTAHGFILLLGLILASIGVAALKFASH